MCGIAGGYWKHADGRLETRLDGALQAIAHRGPDDRGAEFYSVNGRVVVLAQTRLSIIDLSNGGHQPMCSPDGRYVIVFNGEIYNYRELRAQLSRQGISFFTSSDTEVLLNAWITWGAGCLKRLEGMFAFVILDKYANKLVCVRDAFGIKPFFYRQDSSSFTFASELKAIKELLQYKPGVDLQRSYDYLVNGDYDSQPRTFLNGVINLPPAHLIEVDLIAGTSQGPVAWWTPNVKNQSSLSFSQAVEAVREQFLQNIKLQLRSDVPLGAALSGGLDSSSVVCAMRYVDADIPIHTFSYISSNERLSEEIWVDQINKHVGAIPHKIYPQPSMMLDELTNIVAAQGEPFGSTSIYAQYCVFRSASEHSIKVTLDGQGADELLAGYNGYPQFRLLSLVEGNEFKKALTFITQWSQWPGRSKRQACMALADLLLSNNLHKFARGITGRNSSPSWLDSAWLEKQGVATDLYRHPLKSEGEGRRVVERLAESLSGRGLPALLRHADRNSMNFSIESRVPFLTTKLADLLLTLPEDFLISQSGETKHVFRAAMKDIVPDVILNRKDKIGFETNESDWIRGIAPQVRTWLQGCEDIPFLKVDDILNAFDQTISGSRAYNAQIWRWINYAIWYRTNI